jgi:hypothetical protein
MFHRYRCQAPRNPQRYRCQAPETGHRYRCQGPRIPERYRCQPPKTPHRYRSVLPSAGQREFPIRSTLPSLRVQPPPAPTTPPPALARRHPAGHQGSTRSSRRIISSRHANRGGLRSRRTDGPPSAQHRALRKQTDRGPVRCHRPDGRQRGHHVRKCLRRRGPRRAAPASTMKVPRGASAPAIHPTAAACFSLSLAFELLAGFLQLGMLLGG